jgi:hypothetical protein
MVALAEENNSSSELQDLSFRKNITLTYLLAIPMLIATAVLMAIFASWGNEDLVTITFISGCLPALSMAYRQRKLEYWIFSRAQRLLTFGAVMFGALIVLGGFGLFLAPRIGLLAALMTGVCLSLFSLAIFALVDKMKVPEDKQFSRRVDKERKRSFFFMYGFLGIPLFIVFLVFVG